MLNRSFFFITFFFLFTSFKITSIDQHIQDPSKLVLWETEQDHDFGNIKKGSVTKHVFRFKNMDNQAIIIQTVRTTCGCTAAKWTESPIEPGQNGEITIEYDSEKSGAFRKKIKVFFDKQKKAEILYINGEVI